MFDVNLWPGHVFPLLCEYIPTGMIYPAQVYTYLRVRNTQHLVVVIEYTSSSTIVAVGVY